MGVLIDAFRFEVARAPLLARGGRGLQSLSGRVVLHRAVDHVDAAAVGDRLDDPLGEADLLGIGAEHPPRHLDLARMQRGRRHAAHRKAARNCVSQPVTSAMSPNGPLAADASTIRPIE